MGDILAIPPHSRRISGIAIAGLVLISGAAFASGLARQLGGSQAYFPGADTPAQTVIRTAETLPAPAPMRPSLQVATAEPAPIHAASAPPDLTAALPPPVQAAAADPEPQAPPATDAAATVAAQPELTPPDASDPSDAPPG